MPGSQPQENLATAGSATEHAAGEREHLSVGSDVHPGKRDLTPKDKVTFLMKRMLRTQLRADVTQGVPQAARIGKLRSFYKSRLDPESWLGWPEMSDAMTELAAELEMLETSYVEG